MSDELKGRRFSVDIDKLLNGSGIEECQNAGEDYGKADDYGAVLDLARDVASVDYSAESKIRRGLLDKLVNQMAEKNPHGLAGSKDDVLDEDELDKVAGGRVVSGQEQGCALCGCKRAAAGIKDETCPDCGHSRGCHQ